MNRRPVRGPLKKSGVKKTEPEAEVDEDPNATKKCPDCAEEIKAVAKKCRHCGWTKKAKRMPVPGVGTCRACGGVVVHGTPIWAIILAIVFFPLGLLFLLIKQPKCGKCGMGSA